MAELGAAFRAADLGLTPEPRDEHAAYIASWLKALKNDKRFIFQAASHAQRAVDYLHGCQTMIEQEDEAAALGGLSFHRPVCGRSDNSLQVQLHFSEHPEAEFEK